MTAEKSYQSPTTPGLMVTFENYLVEIICLNMDRKLGSKFWSKDHGNKYWPSKYVREISRGIKNLKAEFPDLNNPILRKAIINVAKRKFIKSLLTKKTVEKFAKQIRREIDAIEEQTRKNLEQAKIIHKDSSTFVGETGDTKMAKLRRIEHSG